MRFFLTVILFFSCLVSKTQVPVLEKEIDLVLVNESVINALQKIERQSGCVFSYQSNIINGVSAITAEFKKRTVREILSSILPKKLQYKARGNYIIIKERPVEKKSAKTELSGYVYDASTDKKLANVTIYDKKTLQSATTDEYGFYSITLPSSNECLTINKQNYEDTCMAVLQSPESSLTNISITPAKDTLYWKQKIEDFGKKTNALLRQLKGYVNTLNVKDTLTRNFQFSFLPFVGTNGRMSGSVYNRYSINLLGGYSRGNKLLEVGGVFNITKENMIGGQFAGFFNAVGDSVKGGQFAGFLNITGKSMQGFQGSGFMNINSGTTNGVQGAGFMNMNAKEVNGVTAAGFINVNSKQVRGLQIAGFMNVCNDTLHGITGAGFLNVTNASKRSLEGAGFMNLTDFGKENHQIAGFMNITKKGSTRIQASGFFNTAHVLTGAQVGFINYCDSAKGIPIGFLSFVKSGLHQIEFSADEVFYTNASFRTGVRAFYNVISYGIQPTGTNFWNIGYGFGTSFKLAAKSRMDITLSSHHVSSGGFYLATSELNRLYVGMEYKLAKKMSVAVGPTFNLYVTDALLPQYTDIYHGLTSYTQYENTTTNGFNLKGWVGAKVAIRFF